VDWEEKHHEIEKKSIKMNNSSKQTLILAAKRVSMGNLCGVIGDNEKSFNIILKENRMLYCMRCNNTY
jgi:hypothetical protein